MADFQAWVEKNRALWSRVYDEVIAPDFEKEWGKREEKHKHELNKKDENRQLLFNHINEQIEKNAQLIEENEQLESQLQAQRDSAVSPSKSDGVASTVTLPGDEYRQLSEKFKEMKRKYQDITQKIKYLERKNQAVMQKNKEMKDSVRAWQSYADRTTGKLKYKGETRNNGDSSGLLVAPQFDDNQPPMPSSPGSISIDRAPPSPADQRGSSPAPAILLADLDAASSRRSKLPETHHSSSRQSLSGSVTPKPASVRERAGAHTSDSNNVNPFRKAAARQENKRQDHLGSNVVPPGSSQTTVDETTQQPAHTAGTEDDEDIPQFVSERSLKRKRGPSSKFAIYSDRSAEGTPVKPFRVKDEPPSSPPAMTHTLSRKETIDLDDPMPNLLLTPRHHHSNRGPSNHSNSIGVLRHQRSNSAPFSQTIKNEDSCGFPEPSENISNFRARLQDTAAEVRAISEPSDPSLSGTDILRAIDPNAVFESIEAPTKRLKQASSSHSSNYALLAEYGKQPPPIDENKGRSSPNLAHACLNQRTRFGNSRQTPAKTVKQISTSAPAKVKFEQVPTPISSRATHTPSGGSNLRSGISNTRSNPPDEPPIDNRPIWSMKAPDKRPVPRKAPAASSDKLSPLRTKPVKELRIQDFKPNPAFNQGYTYAFSETVRKRGDRMCLPGCTNTQCCGTTFRILAEAQAPLSPSQEESLLEDYLGDAYEHMLSTQMAAEERAELVLQARTKKMAKDAGKHREAYERRRTPPGFWRVDFPTTQEQEEDRARAREMDAKVVQERWLEAQRKGGRWIFRDE